MTRAQVLPEFPLSRLATLIRILAPMVLNGVAQVAPKNARTREPKVWAKVATSHFFSDKGLRCSALWAALVVLLSAGPGAVAQATHFGWAQITLSSNFSQVPNVAVDASGDVFAVDDYNSQVYEIEAVNGLIPASPTIRTLASGTFPYPTGVAVDASGNVYVSDETKGSGSNGGIWELMAVSGQVPASPTIVELGGGFRYPDDVTVDGNGNVFVADTGNNVIKEIPANCIAGADDSSCVKTLGGGFGFLEPSSVRVDASGNVFVADVVLTGGAQGGVFEILKAGGYATVRTLSTDFIYPHNAAVDDSGNVYVADEDAGPQSEGEIFELLAVGGSIPASPTMVTVGSGWLTPAGIAVDTNGDLYVADTNAPAVVELLRSAVNFGSVNVGSTSGTKTLTFVFDSGGSGVLPSVFTQGAAGLDFADPGTGSCTTNGASHTYKAGDTCTVDATFAPEYPGHRLGAVELMAPGKTLATVDVYGTGVGPQIAYAPDTQAKVVTGLNAPEGLAVDASGNLYIAAPNNNSPASLFEYSPNGSGGWILTATITKNLNNPTALAVDGAGDVFAANYGGGVDEYSLVSGVWKKTASVTTESGAYGMAVDGAGNVYVTNLSSNNVLEYSLVNGAWMQTATVASGLGGPFGVAVDGSGDVFVVDNGNTDLLEYSLVNGAWKNTATIATGLNYPFHVAVDAAGNVYVTTGSSVTEYSLVASAWTNVATIGTGLTLPEGVALDASGNAYITDWSTGNVVEVNRSTPPSLTFATTIVGSISSDSPQKVTVENIGNAALAITALSYPTDFPEESGGGADPCTGTTSLSPTDTCDLNIDFTPQNTGSPLNEDVTLTDNALNVTGAQQSIQVSGTGQAQLAVTASPISAVAETPFSGMVATFNIGADTAPLSDSTATIDWGDGTTSPGNITQPGGSGTAYAVSGTHTYASQGSYTFTVAVNNTQFGNASGQNTASVAPAPATHFMVTAPASAYVGGAFNLTVTALDALNNPTAGYNGTVHFTSSDPDAMLPADSTLSNGSGFFSAALITVGSQSITATDTTPPSLTGTSGRISVTIPSFVVENTNDSGSGSLREALINAANEGSGNITFDPTAFATAQSITLTSGTLNLPSYTTINGPTTGSGASLTNLVTVSGGGSSNNFPVFTTQSSALNATIQNLIITDGNNGGVYNGYAAVLTIQGSTITGNNSSAGTGGVFNDYNASVTINDSTISGNTGAYGGIVSESGGTVTVSESTISGNSATNNGGAILSGGVSVTVTNSTITGNSGYNGGGVAISGGTFTLTDSIVAGNIAAASDPDVDGAASDGGHNFIGDGSGLTGITNGSNGDQVGTSASPLNPLLAALGSYGGPTQTSIPLPGSPAICFINPSAATGTDQRGLPRTTTYSGAACEDVGAVQTDYALSFSTNPTSTEKPGVAFPVAVTLTESGSAFTAASESIPVTLSGGATLAGSPVSASTSAGIASYLLTVTNPTPATGLQLIASLTLNGTTAVTATSSAFNLNSPIATTTMVAGNLSVPWSASSQTVTLVVNVTASGATVSGGTLTIPRFVAVSTPSGTTYRIVFEEVVFSGSPATFTLNLPGGLTVGTYPLQVSYSDSTDTFASSSDSSHALTVTQAATTTAASNASATFSTSAQNVSLAATVTSPTGTVNTGNVTFAVLQGSTVFGTPVTSATVSNGSASVSYPLPAAMPAGTYTIQADYSGTASLMTSSENSATLIVGKATATVMLGGLTQTYTGSPISATATTTPAALTVNFTYNGSANPPTTVGSYTVVGTINNANYEGSATGTLKISQATPSISWSTPAAITYGTALTATQLDATASFNSAAVAGAFVYTPSAGTVLSAGSHTLNVTFIPTDTSDYSTPGPATTTITVNSATLDVTANSATKIYGTANPVFTGSVTGSQNNDSFTESFTTAATIGSNVGSYPIMPSVTGADLSDYTQVVTDGTLTIAQAASTTSLIASATSITPGEPLTLTATVASTTTGIPTGSVTFYDNAIPLGTVTLNAGVASYTTSALAPGIAHMISATYSGDMNFAASSTNTGLTVTVAALEFTLTINGATLQSVYPGGIATYTFNVTPLYGSYAGTMNFVISGLPSGVTATFSPDSIPANGGAQTVTLTISDAALSSAASPPTGLSERIVRFALALLLLPLVGARRMRRNGQRMRNVFYVLVLSCTALSATLLSGCSSANGFFAQAPKDYNLTITATAGTVKKSATVTLDVQ